MATGTCRSCGYVPVAFDAKRCPQCAERNPNPGMIDRAVRMGAKIGAVGGVVFGTVYFGWIYLGLGEVRAMFAILGAIFSLIGGTIIGFAIGFGVGLISKLFGTK